MSSLRVEDERALLGLAHRYAIANDSNDSDAYVAVFTSDAELTVYAADGGNEPYVTFRGHQEIATIPQLLTRFERTFHLVGTYIYTYDSDSEGAVGVVYCVAHHRGFANGRPIDFVQHIRYDDHYRRDPAGGWAIDQRRVTIQWSDLLDVGPSFLPADA